MYSRIEWQQHDQLVSMYMRGRKKKQDREGERQSARKKKVILRESMEESDSRGSCYASEVSSMFEAPWGPACGCRGGERGKREKREE